MLKGRPEIDSRIVTVLTVNFFYGWTLLVGCKSRGSQSHVALTWLSFWHSCQHHTIWTKPLLKIHCNSNTYLFTGMQFLQKETILWRCPDSSTLYVDHLKRPHTFTDVLEVKVAIKPNDQLYWFIRCCTSITFYANWNSCLVKSNKVPYAENIASSVLIS